MKEYEYAQEINSPDVNDPQDFVWVEKKSEKEPEIDRNLENVEIVENYHSKFEIEANKTPVKKAMRSPLPHEVYKIKEKNEANTLNIYNCSPSALEKRNKMASKREGIQNFEKSNLLPQILDMNKNSDYIPNFPLLLNKSLSEGWDPFESVKRSLSNGTLQRDKIFSKIKVNEEIRIGEKAGSNFNPFVKEEKTSHRTASSSYDSHNNEEQEIKSLSTAHQPQIGSKIENSQNLNITEPKPMKDEKTVDQNLLDYLDNYSTDALQKTALILLEKSLARPKSFQVKTLPFSKMNFIRSSNMSEQGSFKQEILSEESSEFKPCNCRKSKCLKLYCECFSNGRKCTSKCDCSPCWNTPAYENLILKSKEQIMSRNPDAFKPKFTIEEEEETKEANSKKHQRGCNCQKSNCLKKYWECYQKGVECSELCRCLRCHNCEGASKTKSFLGK